MKRDPILLLIDIFKSALLINNYVRNLDFESFSKERITQDAVIRRIEIMGEATKNLPKVLTENYPQVNWSKLAKTRDFVVHKYFDIDLFIIWNGLIVADFPTIKETIGKIVNQKGWQK